MVAPISLGKEKSAGPQIETVAESLKNRHLMHFSAHPEREKTILAFQHSQLPLKKLSVAGK